MSTVEQRHIRVDTEQYDKLKVLADKKGATITGLVRRLLTSGIRQEEREVEVLEAFRSGEAQD